MKIRREFAMKAFTILIVDDTFSCRESVAALLRRSGYRVVCAENGRRALGVMEDCSPDLMLLDLAMPDISALEFLTTIRGQLRWKNLPVILFTGSGDVLELTQDLGVRHCLIKTQHSFNDVLTTIDGILRQMPEAAA
jgi:CheY-like chemotaxis protein